MAVLLSNFIYWIINIVELLILARCILSFLPFNNSFTGWVYMATEPILSPFRKLMQRFTGAMPIDFSPILAIFAIQLFQRIIITLIYIIF